MTQPANAQKAITDLSCCAPIFFCHTFCGCVAQANRHIIFSFERVDLLKVK